MTFEHGTDSQSFTFLSSSIYHEKMEIISLVAWRKYIYHLPIKEKGKSLVNIPGAKALKIYITLCILYFTQQGADTACWQVALETCMLRTTVSVY